MDLHELITAKHQAPRYTHDCVVCIYLGRYKEFDLYACPSQILTASEVSERGHDQRYVLSTLVVRHSSEPGDYASGFMCIEHSLLAKPQTLPHRIAMQHALQRALMQGFYVSDESLLRIGREVVRNFKI